MQTQSRPIVNANGGAATGFDSSAASVDEKYYEAVVRELARGQELTGELQAEVLRVLRGQGQSEATAAFILREVSRAFTVCISIMGGSSVPAATVPTDRTLAGAAAAGMRRAKDDGVPRKRTMTTSPYSDGYQWRKYGQKRIIRTSFPRCYYRCGYHRERGCPATKQVQEQHSNGGPRMYLVIYAHEHTCHHTSPTAAAEPEAARSPTGMLDFSAAGLPRGGSVVQVSKEELEQQVLVSSLACVLQGSQCYSGGGSPEGSSSQGRAGAGEDGVSMPAASIETSTELDVMDYYDVTDTLYFGASSSYGGRDDDMPL
uniref:Uncharacterized protein n=1 Tax=Avena sativa TaxID=4498 RepID=A0ACD5VVR4_AVESA